MLKHAQFIKKQNIDDEKRSLLHLVYKHISKKYNTAISTQLTYNTTTEAYQLLAGTSTTSYLQYRSIQQVNVIQYKKNMCM